MINPQDAYQSYLKEKEKVKVLTEALQKIKETAAKENFTEQRRMWIMEDIATEALKQTYNSITQS